MGVQFVALCIKAINSKHSRFYDSEVSINCQKFHKVNTNYLTRKIKSENSFDYRMQRLKMKNER